MKIFRDIAITILLAVLIFFCLRSAVQASRIPSTSMLPSFQIGDYILVNKISFLFSSPKHGDVIIFNPPPPLNPKDVYIKRVIALPGDEVEVKDGKVFVNGNALYEPYIKPEPPRYTLPLREIPPEHYFVLGDNRNASLDSHTGYFVPERNIIGKAWIVYWPPTRWRLVKHYPLTVSQTKSDLALGNIADEEFSNPWVKDGMTCLKK